LAADSCPCVVEAVNRVNRYLLVSETMWFNLCPSQVAVDRGAASQHADHGRTRWYVSLRCSSSLRASRWESRSTGWSSPVVVTAVLQTLDSVRASYSARFATHMYERVHQSLLLAAEKSYANRRARTATGSEG
jgi:hypothetical protein